MPQYILQRDHTHRSTMGVLSFEAGKPTNVPPFMEKEIIAIGGERLDGEVVDVLDKEPEVKLPPTDTEREEALFAAFELLIETNVTTDFTGQGVPTVKAVEKLVDFDVDRVEVTTAWAAHKVAKAEA